MAKQTDITKMTPTERAYYDRSVDIEKARINRTWSNSSSSSDAEVSETGTFLGMLLGVVGLVLGWVGVKAATGDPFAGPMVGAFVCGLVGWVIGALLGNAMD